MCTQHVLGTYPAIRYKNGDAPVIKPFEDSSMPVFQNFTRGGQVQFHTIHMFGQVLWRFIKIVLVAFIVLTAVCWYLKTRPYERYALTQYGKAFVCQGNLFCPKTFTHLEPTGQIRLVTP